MEYELNFTAFPATLIQETRRLTPGSKPLAVPTPGMSMLDYVAAKLFVDLARCSDMQESFDPQVKPYEVSKECYKLADAFLRGRIEFILEQMKKQQEAAGHERTEGTPNLEREDGQDQSGDARGASPCSMEDCPSLRGVDLHRQENPSDYIEVKGNPISKNKFEIIARAIRAEPTMPNIEHALALGESVVIVEEIRRMVNDEDGAYVKP